MTIGLTYNDDLSRVQIALSGLTGIDAVRVERSTNQLLWEIARGGTALPVSSGAASLDDFEFVADLQNFYRVTEVDPGPEEELEADSITPSLAGRVWLKSIRNPFLNRWVSVRDWSPIGRGSRSGLSDISGRSVPIATTDIRRSRSFVLRITTRDLIDGTFDPATEARDLDLILASGDIFFIHVPAGSSIPGGYVVFGDSEQGPNVSRRVVGNSEQFSLPCRVVAAPAPEVVGATLNWATVRRLYGDSWQNVRASNPTWGVLLDTIADPSDLVVL